MRRSTGRLCVELAAESSDDITFGTEAIDSLFTIENPNSLDDVTKESTAIASFELAQYYKECYREWGYQTSKLVSKDAELTVGAIICRGSLEDDDEWIEIASLATPNFWYTPWSTFWPIRSDQETENEWARYAARDVMGGVISCEVLADVEPAWFSQASHIFTQSQITSDYENYALVDSIEFQLDIAQLADAPPARYLFICPVEDFRTGPNSFRWPEYPVYWSLAPCST
ncbi:hypothetical protein K438DRAFT_1810924 [Mycena galopus ATCC 62051]|nr:hypothetical protein K438DRAFT_1810924 [Mycena galopus ATCC 62051]